jgi:hypothetical protein
MLNHPEDRPIVRLVAPSNDDGSACLILNGSILSNMNAQIHSVIAQFDSPEGLKSGESGPAGDNVAAATAFGTEIVAVVSTETDLRVSQFNQVKRTPFVNPVSLSKDFTAAAPQHDA